VRKKITIQRSGGELIVFVDHGMPLKAEHRLSGRNWDDLRTVLLHEGCAERQIAELQETLETHRTATITVSTER
jgi:hypothetical protein